MFLLFVCFWWLQEWFVLCVSIQYWLHPVTHLGEGLSFTCLIVHYWHLQMVRCSQVKVRPAKALWCLILLPHNPALFICDVTGMCCWAPNGRIHGHVFLNFRHQLSTQGMDVWIRECFFLLHSYQQDLQCLFCTISIYFYFGGGNKYFKRVCY